MKQTTGIHSCEPLTMRCKGVFQLNEEITALRRGDNARVAYRSEKVVEGGLITCIPFVIVDESGEGDLLLGRFYEMEGAIVMDNFTARQLFFVDRKLLLPKRPASSLMPLDVDMVEFENRGVVLSNLRASVEPGTENFYVMCIKHRQWNITTLTWVDFRAEYIYDISKFGSDKAGILSVGNVIDVGGHGVSWSDWQGGWIIMAQSTFAHPSIALHLPSIIYIKLSFSLSIIIAISRSTACQLGSGPGRRRNRKVKRTSALLAWEGMRMTWCLASDEDDTFAMEFNGAESCERLCEQCESRVGGRNAKVDANRSKSPRVPQTMPDSITRPDLQINTPRSLFGPRDPARWLRWFMSKHTPTNKVAGQNQVHNEWWNSSQKGINDDDVSLCSSSATTFNSPLFESIARREVELQQSILKDWRTRFPSKKDPTE
ncbi:uncharacterized protein MELLADRAFT_103291 [Melampsora larici-populina 98AG31]|uniref:Uncharacterized protein n=1 Tax=Melampsora larici-populina (strain 98AG31 / pathotype 3-4-7) TaxID=747676 RepID=F4R9X9_MELLP|nr:uncharacterized protein MELLADRAFT_103291 [Melampsora larici-populina 98AG31]EGG10609.1 hypothetical protein MELLADRAFT_103291 [Melampsora larici-populina 98AG31]